MMATWGSLPSQICINPPFYTNGHTPCPTAIYCNVTDLSVEASEWIQDNPEAISYFMSRAQEYKAAGRAFSVQSLIEVYRWDSMIHRPLDADFKMNNSFGAFVGRTLVLRDPSLVDLIRFRKILGESPTFGVSEVDDAI